MIPFNFLFPRFVNPSVPREYLDKPPTLQAIMESIANFDNPNPVKIKNLPEASRSELFDFDYPLSTKITKEYFETQILKKFMLRRIGFETVTAFKLQLEVKLNEIMPRYNMLFDAITDWSLFNDGETTTISSTDNRTMNNTTVASDSSSTSQTNISDRRFSDMPENKITEVQSGEYLDNYNYDTTTNNASASGTSTGTSNTSDNNIHGETITKNANNKIELYNKFLTESNNIMSMIYKDLDCLFYQLI